MSQKLAKTYHAGFQNYIQNIAIVGAGGNIGFHIVSSLLSNKRQTVTALTRTESTTFLPPGIVTKKVDYNSHESLISALQGQDVLIITMSVTAPPDQEAALIRAAASAGVKWIFPNEWGFDNANPALLRDVAFVGERLENHRKLIEDLGVSSWIVLTCGFWYEYSLAGTEWRYGFDFKEKKVTFYGDGKQKINTTTWPQIGRAVAKLLDFKVLRGDEGGELVEVLERFKNKSCYISSFLVSQKDMWESVLRVTGTKKSDWIVRYEDVEERYKNGIELFQKGERRGLGVLMYARSFFPDGAGDFETSKGLSNELLGLPKEDFDECTKGAVERAAKMAGTY